MMDVEKKRSAGMPTVQPRMRWVGRVPPPGKKLKAGTALSGHSGKTSDFALDGEAQQLSTLSHHHLTPSTWLYT